jgi:hypothetical protein
MSRRRAEQKVWQASQFEFEDVIGQVDDIAILSPGARRPGSAGSLARGALNRVGAQLGRPRRSAMVTTGAAVDAELFFAIFAGPNEIGGLPHVGAQLARSAAKVAYIIELWTPQIPGAADYLRQLRGFDHIFLFSRDAIPAVQDITGVPCSYLPTAVDAELFAPASPGPARSIDVTSYGRRLPRTHAQLLAAMDEKRLYYSYDTISGPFDVTGHREHRAALAATLQRSRYAVVYKNNDDPERVSRTAGEESLTNRYFETLAAGAVMLGSAPDGTDFGDCFDWPDAVVPLSVRSPDVLDVIAALDADPERLDKARRTAVAQSLRRHDWCHRWREVLAAAGLQEYPRLGQRLGALEARAALWEAPSRTPG